MNLGEYIKKACAKRFEWGVHDCSTFCAEWVFANTGIDPMQNIRGAYNDDLSAIGFMYDNGGLLKLWTDRMGQPCERASEGSIGVINIHGEHVMGIFSGERWIMLLESGIKGARIPSAKIIRAWSIG